MSCSELHWSCCSDLEHLFSTVCFQMSPQTTLPTMHLESSWRHAGELLEFASRILHVRLCTNAFGKQEMTACRIVGSAMLGAAILELSSCIKDPACTNAKCSNAFGKMTACRIVGSTLLGAAILERPLGRTPTLSPAASAASFYLPKFYTFYILDFNFLSFQNLS